MPTTPFKWTCITCDKEIPQHREHCPECEEKQYRKIGGLLYLPLLNMILVSYGYFTSLSVTLKTGLETLGRLSIAQSSYLFIAAGINFIFLLYVIYTLSLFVRKKKELPLAYILLIAAGLAIIIIDRIATFYIYPDIPINANQVMPIVTHIIYACIWIPYFRCSVRVKKTFIW